MKKPIFILSIIAMGFATTAVAKSDPFDKPADEPFTRSIPHETCEPGWRWSPRLEECVERQKPAPCEEECAPQPKPCKIWYNVDRTDSIFKTEPSDAPRPRRCDPNWDDDPRPVWKHRQDPKDF